ncbi:hypothetical protein quinque_005739 [Culex quinquefasciatus]
MVLLLSGCPDTGETNPLRCGELKRASSLVGKLIVATGMMVTLNLIQARFIHNTVLAAWFTCTAVWAFLSTTGAGVGSHHIFLEDPLAVARTARQSICPETATQRSSCPSSYGGSAAAAADSRLARSRQSSPPSDL